MNFSIYLEEVYIYNIYPLTHQVLKKIIQLDDQIINGSSKRKKNIIIGFKKHKCHVPGHIQQSKAYHNNLYSHSKDVKHFFMPIKVVF